MELLNALIALRDDIQSTPMMHAADAAAREHWVMRLSELIRVLLIESAPPSQEDAGR